MNYSLYLNELEELRSKQISSKVSQYRKFSVILAVLIHFFALVTGVILLVVFSYSLITMLIFHVTMQMLAYLNIYFGPKLYKKHLRKKIIEPDQIMLNRLK